MIRYSEPVPPAGSLAGQGILHLLGTPPFSPLELVLREAGQNIWDARKERRFLTDPPLRMLVRIRTLESRQAEFLREIIFSGGNDDEPLPENALRRLAGEAGRIRVLEICDFGTTGLSGSIDPQGGDSKFIRFIFDFGNSHADGNTGGTYGFGRSSLYLAGNARTIFVDSLTTDENGNPVRRFMGSRIGNSYDLTVNGRNRRFVGRHFWGAPKNMGDGIQPLTGTEAEHHADALGLPRRAPGETGTSILIPWPVSHGEEEVPVTGNHIAEILLENFWPKLVKLPGSSSPPMEIVIEEEGRSIDIPDPVSHPVYGFFSGALKNVRTHDERCCEPIRVGSAQRVTGYVAFVQGPDAGAAGHPVQEGLYNRIALMRPSELVVKYLSVPQAAIDKNWAGVFICSDADDVRRAFAEAEPPAHDDWIHQGLSDRNHKMWVKNTMTKLPALAISRFAPLPPPPSPEPAPSIAGGLDEFSRVFQAGDGDAPGPDGDGGGGGGGQGGMRLSKPEFQERYVDQQGNIIASFKVVNSSRRTIGIRARVDIEGAERDALAEIPEENRPRIVCWRLPSGEKVAGDECMLSSGGEYRFEVQFRGRYAIKTKCEVIVGA